MMNLCFFLELQLNNAGISLFFEKSLKCANKIIFHSS